MPIPKTPQEAADLLGIPLDASRDAITERYKRLAQIYHPDLNPDARVAGERMKELNATRDLVLANLGTQEPKAKRSKTKRTREQPPMNE